jgi:hypothetical protein
MVWAVFETRGKHEAASPLPGTSWHSPFREQNRLKPRHEPQMKSLGGGAKRGAKPLDNSGFE